jgi:hypothetical protein
MGCICDESTRVQLNSHTLYTRPRAKDFVIQVPPLGQHMDGWYQHIIMVDVVE